MKTVLTSPRILAYPRPTGEYKYDNNSCNSRVKSVKIPKIKDTAPSCQIVTGHTRGLVPSRSWQPLTRNDWLYYGQWFYFNHTWESVTVLYAPTTSPKMVAAISRRLGIIIKVAIMATTVRRRRITPIRDQAPRTRFTLQSQDRGHWEDEAQWKTIGMHDPWDYKATRHRNGILRRRPTRQRTNRQPHGQSRVRNAETRYWPCLMRWKMTAQVTRQHWPSGPEIHVHH